MNKQLKQLSLYWNLTFIYTLSVQIAIHWPFIISINVN